MCSIIGLAGSVEAAPLVVEGLRRMEYRGYDSAGVAAIAGGRIVVRKGVGKVAEVNSAKGLDALEGNVAIGHTRWATHGGVTDSNAHPHLSTFGRVAVVHNGIVDNYEELKGALVKEGYSFCSQTDTEVIANLLDKNYAAAGDPGGAVMMTVSSLQGRYAFAAVFEDGTLAAAREHEPLILGISRNGYYVSSDVLGFAGQTDRVIYVENKEFALLASGTIGLYDFSGKPVPHEVTVVAKEFGEAGKGEFVHYTLKEINEQPDTILRAISQSGDELQRLAELLRGARKVHFTGCGTSYNAALIGAHVVSNHGGVEVTATVSSESKYKHVKYGPDSVVVALSQSGETADVLEAVEAAKSEGAKVASLVNVTSSSLARASDVVVPLACGPEVGVAATKSFTSQVATLYRLAEKLAGGGFSTGLDRLPSAVEMVLKSEGVVTRLAKDIRSASDIYVIGAGLHHYSALEASLKLKELSYIHAEALPGGELKHGPLALIDNGTIVVIINPKDETYAGTVASAHEVKARGAKIIGVSDVASDMYDEWIALPQLSEELYVPVEVVPMQLLAYYLAVERSANPDYPRNLAKSVTVN